MIRAAIRWSDESGEPGAWIFQLHANMILLLIGSIAIRASGRSRDPCNVALGIERTRERRLRSPKPEVSSRSFSLLG